MRGENTIPLLSVILPVYNGQRFLAEAIDSILNQTFQSFELIILNDGSSDASETIIKKYTDPRIRYYFHTNMGLAATLNKGIGLSRASLIARQDQDDISLPDRLQKQVSFLNTQPEIFLVGTAAQIIDQNGNVRDLFHRHATEDIEIKYELMFDNPFVHSSVMFRKEAVELTGNYSADISIFEDYDLWSRIARNFRVANLEDVLLRYREVETGMSKSAVDYRARVKKQSLANLLFYAKDKNEKEIARWQDVCDGTYTSLDTVEASRFIQLKLAELTTDFAEVHGVKRDRLKKIEKKKLNLFVRHLLNQIINDEKTSRLEKLVARIKRRLLIFLNK